MGDNLKKAKSPKARKRQITHAELALLPEDQRNAVEKEFWLTGEDAVFPLSPTLAGSQADFDRFSENPKMQEMIRENFREWMSTFHDVFVRTGAGMHAWRTWQLARQTRQPCPEWVLEYFDQAARELEGTRSASQIAVALKMLNPKGGAALRPSNADRQLYDDANLLHMYNEGLRKVAWIEAFFAGTLELPPDPAAYSPLWTYPRTKQEVRQRIAEALGSTEGAVEQRLLAIARRTPA